MSPTSCDLGGPHVPAGRSSTGSPGQPRVPHRPPATASRRKALWITLPRASPSSTVLVSNADSMYRHYRWWWSSMASNIGSPAAFNGIGALRSQHVARAPLFSSFRWLVLACYLKHARPITPNANQPPERPSELAPLAPRKSDGRSRAF